MEPRRRFSTRRRVIGSSFAFWFAVSRSGELSATLRASYHAEPLSRDEGGVYHAVASQRWPLGSLGWYGESPFVR